MSDISNEFEIKYRTAQRWMASVKSIVPEELLREEVLDHGKRRYWITESQLFPIEDIQRDELAAIDEAVEFLKLQNQDVNSRLLRQLATKVRQRLPDGGVNKNDATLDFWADARGFTVQPGPAIELDLQMMDQLRGVIAAAQVIEFDYHAVGKREPKAHTGCPIGFLVGRFHYIVCFPQRRPNSLRAYRLDRFSLRKPLDKTFPFPDPSVLQKYASQFFALEGEPEGDPQRIKLRFSQTARHEAKKFKFHPSQKAGEKSDKSYEVEFVAAGLKSICWELFRWQGQVEILHPPALKEEMKRQLDLGAQTIS